MPIPSRQEPRKQDPKTKPGPGEAPKPKEEFGLSDLDALLESAEESGQPPPTERAPTPAPPPPAASSPEPKSGAAPPAAAPIAPPAKPAAPAPPRFPSRPFAPTAGPAAVPPAPTSAPPPPAERPTPIADLVLSPPSPRAGAAPVKPAPGATAPPPPGPPAPGPATAPAPAAPPPPKAAAPGWWEAPDTFLAEARIRLELFLRQARAGKAEGAEPLEEVCQHLVRSLAEGDQLHVRALDFRKSRNDLVTHMINVAIFAVKIANGLGLKLETLLRVALGGYVHDVGMARFPPEWSSDFQSLSPTQLEELRRHPEEGSKVLLALGPDYRWLADVAHQEHEREDGSGYPRGLRGAQVSEIAKIVGLADIYDSFTHPRPYRNRMVPVTLPHDAVKEIIQAERQRFADRYLKGLIAGLSAFPIGTVVRLNEGSTGRVVATSKALPLRPTLEIFRLGSGDEVSPPRQMSLAQHPLVYITEASPAEA